MLIENAVLEVSENVYSKNAEEARIPLESGVIRKKHLSFDPIGISWDHPLRRNGDPLQENPSEKSICPVVEDVGVNDGDYDGVEVEEYVGCGVSFWRSSAIRSCRLVVRLGS